MEQSLLSSTRIPWKAASRPTLVFIAAYALSMTPHEAAHAVVAFLLGFSSTLFQLWVNPDAAQATPGQQALIAAAGPLFSASVAAVSLLIYRKLKYRPSGLVFLMFGAVGTYIFLGGVLATAMGGDFNIVLTALGTPKSICYLVSAIGLILLPVFMFFVGKELLRWAPIGISRAKAVACTTVAPWLIGTLVATIVYLPLPKFLIGPSLIGSVFWVFAVLGAALGRDLRGSAVSSSISRSDLILLTTAVLMVRLLVPGVHVGR
jgi:hypothetical protein